MCGFLVYTGDASKIENFEEAHQRLNHRGPDHENIVNLQENGTLVFHRLSIMDPTTNGHQPLLDEKSGNLLVCNGEVYNYPELLEQFKESYSFVSTSDCEPILPLFNKEGIEKTAQDLDAEFSFVIYEKSSGKFLAARDPIGIRPLFYGFSKEEGKIAFASEAKALIPFCEKIEFFPPGHYYDGEGNFVSYRTLWEPKKMNSDSQEIVLKNIREKLIEGVRKRLVADVPVGFLLSGGLDSSLVCAIATKILKKPITTFAIGINVDPIDTKYAQVVADYLSCNHHEVLYTTDDIETYLKDVIYHLETYDITTIRAAMGMYLVCKYVHEKTDIKVLLTGEISDEIFGYKYTDFAPNAEEFQKEAQKRLREIHMYDVLRADRSISAHSIEARVPFGDLDFVDYVMSTPAEVKMNSTGIGKYLLRKAFEGQEYLPHDILYREKAAFSDAVGHLSVDHMKAMAENKYSAKDLEQAKEEFPQVAPFTKESLMYREIFESFFPDHTHLVAGYWMPNKSWENCNVDDPSARALPNYGKSGE